MKLKSTNPAKNYGLVGEVEIATDKDIRAAVKKATKAKNSWAATSPEERVKILRRFKDLVFENRKGLATLITAEMGKPLKEANDEINFDKGYLEYYLSEGPKILKGKTVFEDEQSIGRVVFEPYGVAAVITPWNFPLDSALWGVIPNLVAGNTVILKPSEQTPLIAKKIADLFAQAGLPNGVFNILQGGGEVGAKLVDADIDLVWFTGSTKTGQEIYRKAGKKFIKVLLELGGSSPAIVFEDADIPGAVEEVFSSRFSNCGQVCDATKRLFVQKSVFPEFVEKLKEKVGKIQIGDPLKDNTSMGPLVSRQQLVLLEAQVQDAIKKGAKVVIGGKKPAGLKGAYYLPTLLTNIKKNMRVYSEEVFGPVLPIMPFKDAEEAVKLANDTIYGLSSQVYTKNKKLAEEMATKIKAGTVGINTGNYFKPACPFGGYKKSGLGREHGEFGFYELVQIKHIHVKK